MIKRAALALLLAMAGCQATPPEPRQRTTTTASPGALASALERAGLESGQVADAQKLSPIGLYRNHHEAGSDVLCVTPPRADARAGAGTKMHFGLQAVFGENASCSGHGTVHLAGERMILNFARSSCLIVADYEGDRITLPGALDEKCADLCVDNGSLEGVTFPRVGNDDAGARSARDRAGSPLCDSN
ncbi:MAG: hypothetical protein ABI395_01920 [Sphingobium sp.]